MRVTLTHNGGISMRAHNAAGLDMVFDGSPKVGGQELGFRPTEAVAASLAACSAIDFILMLNKAKLAFHDFSITVDVSRNTDAVPAVFTAIDMVFALQGDDLPADKIKRFLALSVDKYCTVAAMLRPGGIAINAALQLNGVDV